MALGGALGLVVIYSWNASLHYLFFFQIHVHVICIVC